MTTISSSQGAPVSVTCWGELPAERKMPGALRVLVGGQHAGAVERRGATWAASWYAGMTASGSMRDRVTEHASAEEAVRAVLRSALGQAPRRPGHLACALVRPDPPGRPPHGAGLTPT